MKRLHIHIGVDEDHIDAIVRHGVSDWLRKPVTNNDLIEKIRVAGGLNALRKKKTGD
jgi:FixJ family two-component response regulator